MNKGFALSILVILASVAVAQKRHRRIGVNLQPAFLVESATGKSLLEPGDLIIRIDGQQFTSLDELLAATMDSKQIKSLDEVLAATNSSFNFGRLIKVHQYPQTIRTTSEGVRGHFVAMVSAVMKGSPAEAAGLKEGDIITRINGHHFKSIDDFIAEVASEDEITITKSPLTDVHQQRELSIKTMEERKEGPIYRWQK